MELPIKYNIIDLSVSKQKLGFKLDCQSHDVKFCANLPGQTVLAPTHEVEKQFKAKKNI
jgi:hypothetical protein